MESQIFDKAKNMEQATQAAADALRWFKTLRGSVRGLRVLCEGIDDRDYDQLVFINNAVITESCRMGNYIDDAMKDLAISFGLPEPKKEP